MSYEIESVRVERMGGETSDPSTMWVTVAIRIRDPGTDYTFSVEAEVHAPAGPGVTLAEVDAAARRHAMTILQEALAALHRPVATAP